MEKAKNKRYSLLLIICIFLLLISIPFQTFIHNELLVLGLMTVSRLLFCFLCLYFVKKDQLIPLKKPKELSAEALFFLPFFLLCGSNFLTLFFSENFQFQFQISTFLSYFIYYLSVALSEELLFRFVLVNYFKNTVSPFQCVLFSSFIFGIIHCLALLNGADFFSVFIQCLYSFGLGFVFSFSYIRTQNLLLPIVLHFIFNLINDTLFSFVIGNIDLLIYYLINGIVAVVFSLYGIFLWFYFKRKDDACVT